MADQPKRDNGTDNPNEGQAPRPSRTPDGQPTQE